MSKISSMYLANQRTADRQYEYWMSASSYLSYGGVLKVVRADDDDLKNANAGVGIASTTTLKIKNYDDYSNNYDTATDFYWAAKNPGSWADNLKVCYIDDLADQILDSSKRKSYWSLVLRLVLELQQQLVEFCQVQEQLQYLMDT